ncbi:MAG: glycerol-3-phosphate 1-O-acyltransferase PlsY [candidate division KSB1 bacterium]|nr:glycerol-3-phosphate 1-O-acyltransferase PlsY [candidate division KSB1 bacterium]MDZ7341708.1 glycerol-3-phosphate 1-O-acyltransferase PlsY [candidate division KSB1 bacterium]
MLPLITIIFLSYLAGSIPTSIIMSRLTRGIDIRDYGSGNAGATNAIRVLGWKIGIIVIIVDVGKGVLATLLISQIGRAQLEQVPLHHNLVQIIAGLSAVLGHIWTIFAGFKGGKGVGTAAGMLFSLYPLAGFICLLIFGVVLLTIRYVSVASMTAAVSLPIVSLILRRFFNYDISSELIYFSIFMAILIIFTHRSNIKRLLKGEENRIKKIAFKKS